MHVQRKKKKKLPRSLAGFTLTSCQSRRERQRTVHVINLSKTKSIFLVMSVTEKVFFFVLEYFRYLSGRAFSSSSILIEKTGNVLLYSTKVILIE